MIELSSFTPSAEDARPSHTDGYHSYPDSHLPSTQSSFPAEDPNQPQNLIYTYRKEIFILLFVLLFIFLFIVLPIEFSRRMGSDQRHTDDDDDDNGSMGFNRSRESFFVVVLGSHGGLDQRDLSSYLITSADPSLGFEFLSLDAGTSLSGIETAVARGAFDQFRFERERAAVDASWTMTGFIFREKIRSYFISHPHADHWLGWLLSTVEDFSKADGSEKKTVFATGDTLDTLQKNVFNSDVWTDLGNYDWVALKKNNSMDLKRPQFLVTLYSLVHSKRLDGSKYKSSGVLVNDYRGGNVLYLGDTGADSIQDTHSLANVWMDMAPLVVGGSLNAIFLECSYTDATQDSKLFGHLKPKLFFEELNVLRSFVSDIAPGREDQLMRRVKIVVTHIKPAEMLSVTVSGERVADVIRRELEEYNRMGLELIFPEQGSLLRL